MRHCGWSPRTRATSSWISETDGSAAAIQESTPTIISIEEEDSSNLSAVLGWDNMGSVSEVSSVLISCCTNCIAGEVDRRLNGKDQSHCYRSYQLRASCMKVSWRIKISPSVPQLALYSINQAANIQSWNIISSEYQMIYSWDKGQQDVMTR